MWYALFLCTGETRGLVIRSQADAVQVVDSTSDEMFLSGPLFFLTCTILVPSRSYRQTVVFFRLVSAHPPLRGGWVSAYPPLRGAGVSAYPSQGHPQGDTFENFNFY